MLGKDGTLFNIQVNSVAAGKVSAKTGTEVIIGSAPLNLVFRTQVTVGGDNVSARELLVQALDGTGQPLVYNLMYFATTGRYIMNVSGTAQALHDTYGRKTLIPSGRRPN